MKHPSKLYTLLRYLLLPVVVIAGLGSILATGGDGDGDGTNTLVFTANEAIDWVAVQDGDGAWTRVEPDTYGGNVYTLTIEDADGKYGVATHEVDGNVHSVVVVQATLGELSSVTSRPTPYTHNVTINAINLNATTNLALSRDDMNVSSDGIYAPFAAEDGTGRH